MKIEGLLPWARKALASKALTEDGVMKPIAREIAGLADHLQQAIASSREQEQALDQEIAAVEQHLAGIRVHLHVLEAERHANERTLELIGGRIVVDDAPAEAKPARKRQRRLIPSPDVQPPAPVEPANDPAEPAAPDL